MISVFFFVDFRVLLVTVYLLFTKLSSFELVLCKGFVFLVTIVLLCVLRGLSSSDCMHMLLTGYLKRRHSSDITRCFVCYPFLCVFSLLKRSFLIPTEVLKMPSFLSLCINCSDEFILRLFYRSDFSLFDCYLSLPAFFLVVCFFLGGLL